MSDALRRRGAKKDEQKSSSEKTEKEAKPGEPGAADFNPLTLRAVSTVFKRRWAAPLTVAAVCLLLHLTGVLDDPNQPPPAGSDLQSFMQKMRLPLVYAKYGAGFGAFFGSVMWVLVVTLSDDADGKPDEGVSEHWAHNNTLLFAVLLGLGTATGAVLGFVACAMLDVVQQGMSHVPIPTA